METSWFVGFVGFVGAQFLFKMINTFWKWVRVIVLQHQNVPNAHNATELYIFKWLKGCSLYYIYFTTIIIYFEQV